MSNSNIDLFISILSDALSDSVKEFRNKSSLLDISNSYKEGYVLGLNRFHSAVLQAADAAGIAIDGTIFADMSEDDIISLSRGG